MEEVVDTMTQSFHAMATESPLLIDEQMEVMLLSLVFSQVVAKKLVGDQ